MSNNIKYTCYSCAAIVGLMFAFIYSCWINYNASLAPAKINYQLSTQSRTEIFAEIDKALNHCKDDFWISWIVASKNIYSFEDVRGYDNKKRGADKVISAKKLNDFYLKSHVIDKNSLRFLNSIETGFPASFSDLIDVKNNYPSIYEAVEAANSQLDLIILAVTKNLENKDVVYIFTMSSSNPANKKCSKKDMAKFVREISIFAKRGL